MCIVTSAFTGALSSQTGAEGKAGKGTKVFGATLWWLPACPQPPKVWLPWISRSAHSAPSNNSFYCLCHIALSKEFEGWPDKFFPHLSFLLNREGVKWQNDKLQVWLDINIRKRRLWDWLILSLYAPTMSKNHRNKSRTRIVFLLLFCWVFFSLGLKNTLWKVKLTHKI